MEQATGGRKIFYGWWIVAASFVVLMFHAGAAFYAYGRFMPTLIDVLGASTTAVSAAVSVYLLVLGLTGPIVGKLTEKYGPKLVLLCGGVIAAAGLMLLSLTSSLWHLYALYFVVGLGMSGAGTVPVSVAIANWFTKRRGLAIGITMAGVSVGAIAIAPLAHVLITSIGWQMAYLVIGALTLVCIVVPVLFLMKTRPGDMGLLPDGAQPGEHEAATQETVASSGQSRASVERVWSAGMALKTLPLWLILVTFFFSGAGVAGVLQHEVRMLDIVGIPIAAASVALGLTGLIGGGGKIGFGFIADKMSPKWTTIICIAMQLIGIVILMFTHSTAMVWLFVIVFGFAMGGNIAVQPLIAGHFFGTASLGTIFGWVLLAGAVGSALGPIVMGAIYDMSGSYSLAIIVFLATYAVALAAVFLARKPKSARQEAVD
jgi:MFS family permease